MNFFEQQDIARRNTKRLIFLLVLAVTSLIAITVLLVAFIFAFSQGDPNYSGNGQAVGFGTILLNSFHWETVIWVSLIVCTVVSFGSFYKVLQLRSGGRAVAEAMGGRLLNLHTQDADEKKILNVVEEIAIASGTPVPSVYIIEDEAINAFAAGHNPQNAVIGITRGCIHLLNRDELQGVVAHEFSHIFHGDMRINIRLVALLHGILLLGLIGGFVVRSTHHRSMFRSSRDKSPAALLALGVGLMVIGYAGTFFGNIIKAAVSRQREFLADASAVQFTRNPDGIAGALKKIGGHVHGSHLQGDNVAEFSHMYFSEGIKSGFTALMATHPPLTERIKRIEPRWNGQFPDVEISLVSALKKGAAPTSMQEGVSELQGESAAAYQPPNNVAALNKSIDAIGQPSSSHLAYAHQKLFEIGEQLKAAARDPFNARALIFGLFLDPNPTLRERQWELLAGEFSSGELADIKIIAEQASRLDASLRLPLTELALSSLKELTANQYASFKRSMEILIQADKKISLMEWALQRIVHHHLEPHRTSLYHRELRDHRSECQLLLSVLAYAGAKNETEAQAAFVAAVTPLRFSALQILPKSACKMALLDSALTKLNTIKPLQKPQLLKAMMGGIAHDGKITVIEAELFRAIADGLDCPIPPLIVTGN